MILSVIDAQDLYLSAKAFTALTISELEAEWYQPAIEQAAKVMAAMQQFQQTPEAAPMPDENQQLVIGGGYAADKQNIL